MTAKTNAVGLARWRLYVRWAILAISAVGPAMAGRLSADEPLAGTDLYGDPLPTGAVVRLGTIRYRTPAKVSGLGFTDDNQSLIFISGRGEVTVVDPATGRTVRTFRSGELPAGMRIATDRRATVAAETGKGERPGDRELEGTSRDVISRKLRSQIYAINVASSGAFDTTFDGRMLVVGSEDGTIHCWDLTTGDQVAQRKLDKPRLTAVAISPDGNLIVASAFNRLFFWERLTDKQPESIDLGRTVLSLAFSPDGSLLAEGPDSRKDIVLRDVATRTVLRTLSNADGFSLLVRSLAFTSDGKGLAATNSIGMRGKPPAHRVHVWDVASGDIRHQFSTGDMHPNRVAVSGDSHFLAAAVGGTFSGGATIKVWDLRTGRLMGDDFAGHDPDVTAIQFSRDGQSTVTAGDDGTVRLWDAVTGRQKHLLRHDKRVRSAALSPDGSRIASSSLDDTVRLWDASNGQEVHRLPGHGEIGGYRNVAFSPDGQQMVSWGDDFNLRIWSVTTGRLVSERQVHPADIVPQGQNQDLMNILASALSSDGKRLAIASPGGVSLFEVESGMQLHVLPRTPGRLARMVLSPDGSRLLTSVRNIQAADRSQHHVVSLLEFESGDVPFDVLISGPDAAQIAFSGNGRVVAVAGRAPDGKIAVLDVATADPIAKFEVPPYDITALGLTPDGKRLACGLSGGTVLIWDLPAVKEPQK